MLAYPQFNMRHHFDIVLKETLILCEKNGWHYQKALQLYHEMKLATIRNFIHKFIYVCNEVS